MLKKIIPIILICLSIGSLFFPFQEYKSMWADFAPDGSLVDANAESGLANSQNNTISGLQLIIPVFLVSLLTIGNLFGVFAKKKTHHITSLIFTGVSVVFILFLYRSLGATVEAETFSPFRPPVPMIGLGYYLLLFISIVSAAFSLYALKSRK